MDSLSLWNVKSFNEILYENDLNNSNHKDNVRFIEDVDKNNFLKYEKAIVNDSGVGNSSEGVAACLISDDINVYNTNGGSVITQRMSKDEKQTINENNATLESLTNGKVGNPDFTCFKKSNGNLDVFFIEVKKGSSDLTNSQYEWLNKNKWAKTYVLRIQEQLEFNEEQLLSPKDLIKFNGVTKKPQKILKE